MAWDRAEMKSSLSVPFPSICFICTWLICMAETWAEHTEEWLGELGRDLQGPMESCCFFLVETIFWATEGKQNSQAGQAEHPWEAGTAGEHTVSNTQTARLPPPQPAPNAQGRDHGEGQGYCFSMRLHGDSSSVLHKEDGTPEVSFHQGSTRGLRKKKFTSSNTRNSVPSPLCVYDTTLTEPVAANIFPSLGYSPGRKKIPGLCCQGIRWISLFYQPLYQGNPLWSPHQR